MLQSRLPSAQIDLRLATTIWRRSCLSFSVSAPQLKYGDRRIATPEERRELKALVNQCTVVRGPTVSAVFRLLHLTGRNIFNPCFKTFFSRAGKVHCSLVMQRFLRKYAEKTIDDTVPTAERLTAFLDFLILSDAIQASKFFAVSGKALQPNSMLLAQGSHVVEQAFLTCSIKKLGTVLTHRHQHRLTKFVHEEIDPIFALDKLLLRKLEQLKTKRAPPAVANEERETKELKAA